MSSPHAVANNPARRRSASRNARIFWYTILCAISLLSIWWPVFNRMEPELLGIPFFFWFQFALIAFSAVVTGLAYKAGA